jgi:hypothetical protein
MRIQRNFLTIVRLTTAFGVLAAAAPAALHAQQVAASLLAPVGAEVPTLLASDIGSPSLFSASTPMYSSSVGASEEAAAENFNLSADGTQPPPRRRYGRPNYSDSHTNADGSNKYTFFAGGGFTLPVGGTHNDLGTSFDFQFGGGRNFNKRIGVMLQFDYDRFGFQQATLNNLLNNIYNNPNDPGTDDAGFTSLGGTSHIWSFTLDPVYTFTQPEAKIGAYATAGVGFFHKVADFTTPTTGEEVYFGELIQYQANEVVDSYVSNAVGFDLGFGATYKFSRFAGERLYVEGKYVYMDNSPRSYVGTTTSNEKGVAFNAFPQNAAKTTYIPITIGIRF